MKRLILMRHAEAGWHLNIDDHERPLTSLGIRDAEQVCLWLKENKYIPDEVLSSTSTRTKETFYCLSLECVPNFKKSLYLAEANQMKSTLQTLLSNAVFLLGHNPGINELACDLLDHNEEHRNLVDFPPSTALIIDFEIDQWTELKSNCGKLIDFITPGKFQIN